MPAGNGTPAGEVPSNKIKEKKLMKMVTRTVTSYSATVLVVDTTTTEVGTRQYVFTTNPKNEEAVIKYANEKLQGTGLRAVAVKETAISTSLYGMPEEKFLELAEKLPPRRTKAAGDDSEATV